MTRTPVCLKRITVACHVEEKNYRKQGPKQREDMGVTAVVQGRGKLFKLSVVLVNVYTLSEGHRGAQLVALSDFMVSVLLSW